MITNNRNVLILCAAALLALCPLADRLTAQSIPPVPAPTPGEIAPEKWPNAQITMDDGTGLSLKMRGRSARRVLLSAGQRTTVNLRYDSHYSGVTLEAAALDGGTISFSNNSRLVPANGEVLLEFSGAQQPGLYRIWLNCAGTISVLQFWVPDPTEFGVDDSVAVPQALSN